MFKYAFEGQELTVQRWMFHQTRHKFQIQIITRLHQQSPTNQFNIFIKSKGTLKKLP
jgi:hypothetical protein